MLFRIMCFSCCVIFLCDVSDANFDNLINKGGVVFRNYKNDEQKALKKCSQYIVQACGGILKIQPNSSAIKSFGFASPKVELPLLGANKSDGNITSQIRGETSINETAILNFTIGNMVQSAGISTVWHVVGGRRTFPKEFPHMALIGYGEYQEVKWLCGGSLISEQYVLSAAHCSSTSIENAQWVRLGELDLESKTDDANTNDFQIIERIVHPGYNPPSLYNDIALFKLKTAVKFSNFIRPICLNVVQDLNVTRATATGWGSTGYGEKVSTRLLSVDLDIQDYRICDKIYKGERLKNGFNVNTMICAGYSPGGKDTCQGDSGGPLQIPFNAGCPRLYLQIGIVSYGQGCAFPDTPAIYTKVSYFISWIESIIWK